VKPAPIGSAYKFQPRQIVCLEYEDTYLYTEVIEVVTSRSVCWVRPLMLVISEATSDAPTSGELLTLYDLRQGADLVWPTILFRAALDTEVIPLLAKLDNLDANGASSPDVHKQLSLFVRKVWLAYKETF
jgi:hypothetical protein